MKLYFIIKAGSDDIGGVWDDAGKAPKIHRVYLPDKTRCLTDRILKDFPLISKTPRRMPGGMDQIIADLYAGKKRQPDLSALTWSGLSAFAIQVLKLTARIPHGAVTTYSALAARAGSPGAARAVGSVMAKNPFPLIIPCHRVIRADKTLGQYGGGPPMKAELLRKEGVIITA